MTYAPTVVFLLAVLWAWAAGRSGNPTFTPSAVTLAGCAGLVSAAVSAWLIHDQSSKGNPDASNIAIALLVAHALLFFALLLVPSPGRHH